MPKFEYWFKQDLKKPVRVNDLSGVVFTLDNVGSRIGVEVFDDGEPVALTGTVNGYVIIPGETTVSVAGTSSNNTAYIELPQSALATPGFIKIAIKLTNSSEITTLLAVVATVYKSRTDTIITPSQQIITDWSQQIAAEMQAVEDASAAQDAKIDDLKSAIDAVRSNTGATESIFSQSEICKNLLNPQTVIIGYKLSDTTGAIIQDSSYAVSDFIPVKQGGKYSFFKYENSVVSLGVVNKTEAYDKNGNFLSALGPINSNNKIKTIPNDGTAYIRIQYTVATYSDPKYIMLCAVEDETLPDWYYYGETNFRISDYAKETEIVETNQNISRLEETVEEVTDVLDVALSPLTGTLITGKYINIDGSIADLETYQILKVAVTPFTDYWITARAYAYNYFCVFHDANENLLDGGIKGTETGTNTITDVKVTSPANAAYIYVASPTKANVQAVKEFDHYVIPKVWAGKKWVVFGDSLTEENARTTKHYFDYVSELTGINVYNMGNSGSGYMKEQDIGTAFYQRISSVPLDADVITIFGSFNDNSYYSVLGTATDTGTTTIGGCINTTLDNLFEAFPLANVGIVTPTPWQGQNPTTEPNNASAYVALIKQICDMRSIPCLDLFHCSQLRPWDADFRALAYSKDDGGGTHPDETGHAIIAPRFEAFLDSLLLR